MGQTALNGIRLRLQIWFHENGFQIDHLLITLYVLRVSGSLIHGVQRGTWRTKFDRSRIPFGRRLSDCTEYGTLNTLTNFVAHLYAGAKRRVVHCWFCSGLEFPVCSAGTATKEWCIVFRAVEVWSCVIVLATCKSIDPITFWHRGQEFSQDVFIPWVIKVRRSRSFSSSTKIFIPLTISKAGSLA